MCDRKKATMIYDAKIKISGHHNCSRCRAKDVDLYIITEPYLIRDICKVCVKVITGLWVRTSQGKVIKN